MRDADLITPDLESTLTHLGPIGAVVGVVTLNNAETVDPILRAARQGAVWNGGPRTLVVHADGGSQDGTVTRAHEALRADDGAPVFSVPDPEIPRPGRELARSGAIRAVLVLARRLGARGCAVLDGSRLGVAPDWVGRLLSPVLEREIDFVAPYYLRPRFAGAIVSGIVYPMTRALYGKRVRFPLAEDFACSPRLVDRYLSQAAVWENDLIRTGPDVWLGTQALTGGFRLSQVSLGTKLPSVETAADDLPHTLGRVLGALFAEVERNQAVWQKVRGSEPVELEGQVPPSEPGVVPIDVKRSLDGFRLGQANLRDIWGLVLSPLALLELQKLARQPDDALRFPDALWARIVYDFALAYRLRTLNRDHLLAAFAPLYLGWLGSFVSEAGGSDGRKLESRIDQLCLRYEMEKPYLISRWRSPDRFNP
jgi:hypothetical protein